MKFTEDEILHVEGMSEGTTGNIVKKKSFKHHFNVKQCDITRATASLSSDGILKMVIPKMVKKQILLLVSFNVNL